MDHPVGQNEVGEPKREDAQAPAAKAKVEEVTPDSDGYKKSYRKLAVRQRRWAPLLYLRGPAHGFQRREHAG
jgi:hypothetical protein